MYFTLCLFTSSVCLYITFFRFIAVLYLLLNEVSLRLDIVLYILNALLQFEKLC
jgi:hypothetical protein